MADAGALYHFAEDKNYERAVIAENIYIYSSISAI
jgi:hypothetical protein